MNKKRNIFIAILSIAAIMILTVCFMLKGNEEKEMPLIVFQFTLIDCTYNYPNSSSTWTIDNEGNIYYFNDYIHFDKMEVEEAKIKYENLKQDKYARYVGKADMQQFDEKYKLLLKVVKARHYEKNMAESDNTWSGDPWDLPVKNQEYIGDWIWKAYIYDRHDRMKLVSLYEEGNSPYISEDGRMKEIADWMKELLHDDILKNKKICDELESKDWSEKIQQYIEERKSE